jgi:hypothetical protein
LLSKAEACCAGRGQVDYEDRDDDLTSQEIFFEKAVLVLFDLPVRVDCDQLQLR